MDFPIVISARVQTNTSDVARHASETINSLLLDVMIALNVVENSGVYRTVDASGFPVLFLVRHAPGNRTHRRT